MERFAIKIDKSLRANLYKICRLCGIDNPDKIKVRDDANIVNLEDGEPELWKKVFDCIGLMITKDDKMPQFMCTLCVDKINDFFEFREMCYATDGQTRKLLGIKTEPKVKLPAPSPYVDFKTEDIKEPIPEVTPQRTARKRRNADMEITGDIKVDITEDIKPSTTNNANSATKKKRLRLSNNAETEPKIEPGTKPTSTSLINTKKEPKTEPPAKIPLTKKRLKTEPVVVKENKKNIRSAKLSNLMKKKLKVELTPTDIPEAQQSAKKKKVDLAKVKKFPQLVVKTEKLKKGILDTKIKEETPGTEADLKNTNSPTVSSSSKIKTKSKETCKICSEGFMNKGHLDKHVKSTHIPTIQRYHCVQCNETLKKNMEIKNHNLWHKLSKTPFRCGNCSESSCSIYTYSKHIRDCNQVAYLDTHIPDWHCPDCSGIYETTYLFNIHSCVSKRLVCPGCEKTLKWKEDYFKHIPTCEEAFQRIPPYMTSNIQVKNEAELPTSPIPSLAAVALPTTSIPIVGVQSTTPARIAPPALDSNQCVVIPGNISLHDEAGSSSPSKNSRKGKRITKKDLKRFDKLLKSTMTTLVSIKHEPHQDDPDGNKPSATEVRDQSESTEQLETSPESPPGSPMSFGGDDFHHNGDDSDGAEEECPTRPVGTIKQEIIDEGYRDLYNNIEVNIKHENTGDEMQQKKAAEALSAVQEPALAPKPILKLKITKEHGTLNSILMDSPKSEKKKKKKKRKEDRNRSPEKEEQLCSSESNTAAPTEAVPSNENTATKERDVAENINAPLIENSSLLSDTKNKAMEDEVEPIMPLPEIVNIKKEITEPETHKGDEEASSQNTPSIVAAFSGSLQISCVSEGVTFDKPDENPEAISQGILIPAVEQTSEEPSTWTEPVLPMEQELMSPTDSSVQDVTEEPEEEIDIKPRLEDLIPMLQIKSVTSVADAEQETEAETTTEAAVETEPVDKPAQKPVKRKRRPAVAKSDPVPKIVSVSSGTAVVPYHTETDITAEDNEDISKKDAESNQNDFVFSHVKIKEEVVDSEYDEQNNETPTEPEEEVEDDEAEMDDGEEEAMGDEEEAMDNDEEAQDEQEVFEKDDEDQEIENDIQTTPIISKKQAEENAYIANIDFSNLIIKQEKEYIDDGVETSTAYEENEDECEEAEEEDESSEIDSEESSSEEETEKSDSESEREYRDLPSEDDNNETDDEKEKETTTSPAPLGLQILAVHTDVNFSPSNQKTEINSDDKLSNTTEQNAEQESVQLDNQIKSNTDNIQAKQIENSMETSMMDVDSEFESVKEATLLLDAVDKSERVIENLDINTNDEILRNTTRISKCIEMTSNKTEQDSSSILQNSESILESLKSAPTYSSETNLTNTNLAKVCDALESKAENFNPCSEDEEQNIYDDRTTPAHPPETSLKIDSLGSMMSIDSDPRLDHEISNVDSPSQLQPERRMVDEKMPCEVTSQPSSKSVQPNEGTETLNPYYNTAYRSADSHATDISLETSPDRIQQSDAMAKKEIELTTQPVSSDLSGAGQEILSQISRTSAAEVFNEITPLDGVQQSSTPVQSLVGFHLQNASSYTPDSLDTYKDKNQIADPPSSFENTPQISSNLTVNHTQMPLENTNILTDLGNAVDSSISNIDSSPQKHDLNNLNMNEPTFNIPPTHMEFQQFNNPGSSYTALNCTTDPSSFTHYQDLTPPTAGQLQTSLVQHPVSNESNELSTNSLTNLSVLTEEVQNLLNEDTVAVNNFEFNDSVLRARSSAPPINPEPIFNDFENLNEIAENNNNANIERELQDELGNALADAIADRSNDADNVDDDNVMNENRANFDIT